MMKKSSRSLFFRLRDFLFVLCVVVRNVLLVVHKEHRDAPYTGESDENIQYSCHNGSCSTEYPRHEVEGEEPHQTPVECADYYKSERDFVYYRHIKYDRTLLK